MTCDHTIISVIVVSYNHERFIAQCLDSIAAQKGDFKIELVIGDDFSTDRTGEIIRDYVERIRENDRFIVKFLPTDHNYGMVGNYKRCFDACTGDYLAICEGDDYWLDDHKLQKQMDFLKLHPQCSMCFNDLYVLFQDTGKFERPLVQQQLKADILKTRDLVLVNSIWNFSCCMYDARHLHELPEGLYDLYFADWMFNICYSEHGDIGHLKEPLSVYRKHGKATWSAKSFAVADNELYILIDSYNKLLNFNYDAEFSEYQRNLEENSIIVQSTDVAIIGNIHQNSSSTFWMWELKSYLGAFENSRFYSLNKFQPESKGSSSSEGIAELKRRFPEHAHQIKRYYPHLIRNAKLVYSFSLRNAYEAINIAEKLSVPFVFSLYEGDGFDLSDRDSNSMLKRITSSPCLRKVIVTRALLYDYLAGNQYCGPGQIEYICGVDNPLKLMNDHDMNQGLYEMQILARINLLQREIEQAASNRDALIRTMKSPTADVAARANLKQRALNLGISVTWNVKRILPQGIKNLIKKPLRALTPQWLRNAIREKINGFHVS